MIATTMAEDKKNKQLFQDSWFLCGHHMNINDRDETSSSSVGEESTVSNGSSISSSDITDDASSANSDRAMYDMSDIMKQLPIKRGLSKYYQGKSESFTSVSMVTSIGDLTKKTTTTTTRPYKRRLKASIGTAAAAGLHRYKPKPIITKKGFFFK